MFCDSRVQQTDRMNINILRCSFFIIISNIFSSDCRDLLSRCLVRSPEKRIDFPDFFSHPFLDLEHLPDEDSFQKASALVTRVSSSSLGPDRC